MNHFLCLLIIFLVKLESAHGLSVPLYHKNSPLSPSKKEFEAKIEDDSFLLQFYLGSTQTVVKGVLDSGSDLVWSQCEACVRCPKTPLARFNPKNSPSYKLIYETRKCESLRNKKVQFSHGRSQQCIYQTKYQDKSTSQGDLATDLVTLRSTDGGSYTLENFTFGCGNKVSGEFGKMDMGIVGLGPGSLSLISQMRERIFSYCMLPQSTGKLRLGKEARIKNPLVSIPFLDDQGYYHLILEGISVGNERIKVPTETGKGNMAIDSGASVTDLKPAVYKKFKDLVKAAIRPPPQEIAEKDYSLCYKLKSPSKLNMPDVTFHFKGGSLPLPETSVFKSVKNSQCLAIDLSDDGESTLGSFQQINFNVGFDLNSKKVSFAPVVGGRCD